ncbi:MAG TPA: type II toxin-antitoxin system VapC family toxin [Planctomycetota bacterium]|jgi:predicted nucleic acid-binding protein|nr:type II toxin-antitoxin system VapC family toxin [Planctomycetota bacterium]
MGAFFLDSSACVKRYVLEAGTEQVRSLFQDEDHDLFLCRLAGPEIVSALTRRRREKDLDENAYTIALEAFHRHLQNDLIVIEVTKGVLSLAMDMARRYAIRGADAVHLAAACEVRKIREQLGLSTLVFVCSDETLNRAAQQEGFELLNPEGAEPLR